MLNPFPSYQCGMLNHYFRCSLCGRPLLMFGCDNPNCKNYYKKRLEREKNDEVKKS